MANLQLKEYICQILSNDKPQSVKELIDLILTNNKKAEYTKEECVNCIIELENENKLFFPVQEQSGNFVSKLMLWNRSAWFWGITILVIAACIAVLFVSPLEPYSYVRYGLSAGFVLFLPGYVVYRLFFGPRTCSNVGGPDLTECIVLSVGISLVITIAVGLLLNYSPWGITVVPITLSLAALTIMFAIAVMYVENRVE
jgi:uncharacterized membrane protein